MKYNIFCKSVLDGVLRFLFLRGLLAVYAAEFARNIPLELFLLAGALGATVLVGVYVYFLINELSNKKIVLFSLCSECCCIVCWMILFAIQVTWHITVFPMRELNNGDGTLILICAIIYFLVSVFLRGGVFITLLIKNLYRARKRSQ